MQKNTHALNLSVFGKRSWVVVERLKFRQKKGTKTVRALFVPANLAHARVFAY